MARIIGIEPGLNPTNTPERDAAEARRARNRTRRRKLQAPPEASAYARHEVGEILCDACAGQIGFATAKKALPGRCSWCRPFFDKPFGVTFLSPENALQRIAKIREAGWVMILRRGRFAARNGERYEVDPGDIVRVARCGSDERETRAPCSKERTHDMFTVSVMLGSQELALYPHEVHAISFQTILELQRLHQVEMAYVSNNDEHGHFVPSAQMREQIARLFGSTVGL